MVNSYIYMLMQVRKMVYRNAQKKSSQSIPYWFRKKSLHNLTTIITYNQWSPRKQNSLRLPRATKTKRTKRGTDEDYLRSTGSGDLSSKSERNYSNVFQRMGNIRDSSMLHELSRRECASMTDANYADLRFRISVQEPIDGFSIRTISCRRYQRHLWKGKGILTLELRFRRFSNVRLGFFQGTRARVFSSWDGFSGWNWVCCLLYSFFFAYCSCWARPLDKCWDNFLIIIAIIMNLSRIIRVRARASTLFRMAIEIICFWTIYLILSWRGMTWMGSSVTATTTWEK